MYSHSSLLQSAESAYYGRQEADALFEPVGRRPLRIFHVDTGKYWRGSQHQIIYSIEEQLWRGHDVRLICLPGVPISEHAGARGLPVIEMPIRGEFDLAAIARLARIFRALKPDVVHLQSAHAHLIGGAAGRIAGVPALILSRRLDNRITGALGRWKYRHFYDAIISVSESVKDVLVRAGVRPEAITTVYSSVPTPSAPPSNDGERIRRELGLDASHSVIVTLAHIEYRKGIDTLVEAMPVVLQHIPNARVLIVGDGSHRPAVEQKMRAMALEGKVFFTGFRSDVQDILAAADVVVSPSYLEGCCNALMEGMAAGKPVIGSRVGGTPEIIEHWVNGLLVPPKDPDALAWAMVRVLSDAKLSRRFGEAGMATVIEKFSIDRMVGAILDVYYRVLNARATS